MYMYNNNEQLASQQTSYCKLEYTSCQSKILVARANKCEIRVPKENEKKKKKRDKIKSGKLSSSKQGFAQYIRGQDMIIRNIVSLLACVGLFVRQNLLMLVSKIRVGAQDRSSPPRGYDSHRATYCPPIISTGNNNKYRLVCAENKKIPLKRGIT